MSQKIEFFYDVLSPYSYLAFCRLQGMAKRLKTDLELRPLSMPRLHEKTGNTPPALVPSRFAYVKKDIDALGRYYGIPVQWPKLFPCRTGRAMSVLTLAKGSERLQLTRQLFSAYWIEGMDIGDPEVLANIVGEQRLNAAAEPVIREQLQSTTEEAAKRGAFGVPTCFVGEHMFFGNDRLFMLQVHMNR